MTANAKIVGLPARQFTSPLVGSNELVVTKQPHQCDLVDIVKRKTSPFLTVSVRDSNVAECKMVLSVTAAERFKSGRFEITAKILRWSGMAHQYHRVRKATSVTCSFGETIGDSSVTLIT